MLPTALVGTTCHTGPRLTGASTHHMQCRCRGAGVAVTCSAVQQERVMHPSGTCSGCSRICTTHSAGPSTGTAPAGAGMLGRLHRPEFDAPDLQCSYAALNPKWELSVTFIVADSGIRCWCLGSGGMESWGNVCTEHPAIHNSAQHPPCLW